MGVVLEPDSLWNLALGALGQYICSVSENPTVDTCQRLKVQLTENIPPSLANKVTAKLLRDLNRNVWNLGEEHEELVTAIILPSVTILDFAGDIFHSHELWSTVWQESIVRAVWKSIDTLNNLKVLSFKKEVHEIYSLTLPSSLVEFTCSSSHYDGLEQLSACCKCLKKLDVCNSRYIDDYCIALILTFEHLEVVNVEGTRISYYGLTDLLEGFARNTKGPLLKRFGSNELILTQFIFLLEQFKEIVHLDFDVYLARAVNEDTLKLLPSLKQLNSLCINDIDFPIPDLGMILDIIGSQLILLDVCIIDLYKVAEKCISLECLHLQSQEFISVEFVEVLKKLPGLKSVKCLQIHETCPEAVACFVSLCRKIEVLDVYFPEPDFEGILLNAFINEPLTSLRVFRWDGRICFKKEVMLRLVECCPSLEMLRGAFAWNRRGNEAQREEYYLLSPDCI